MVHSKRSSCFRVVFPFLIIFFACSVPSGMGEMEGARGEMVESQIKARGVRNPRVLEAMRRVKRHKFVPVSLRPFAYLDQPLPIDEDQTISQPYIVALMTELLSLDRDDRVLEIGTGSGYQAAVLAEVVREVYTIEIIPSLAESALEHLKEVGYTNVIVRTGDGYLGWPEKAPFDGIIVTAAPDDIPKPLLDQLKVGGRMVIPIGSFPVQILYLIHKTHEGIKKEEIIPVRFVPMTGLAQEANFIDSERKIS